MVVHVHRWKVPLAVREQFRGLDLPGEAMVLTAVNVNGGRRMVCLYKGKHISTDRVHGQPTSLKASFHEGCRFGPLGSSIGTATNLYVVISPGRQHGSIGGNGHIGKPLPLEELLHLDFGRAQERLQSSVASRCEQGETHAHRQKDRRRARRG